MVEYLEALDHFFKHTTLGIILGGTIGGALLLLILRIYGKANQGLKALRVLYKEGRQRLIKDMAEDENFLQSSKQVSQMMWFSTVIMCIAVMHLDDDQSFFMELVIGSIFGLSFLLAIIGTMAIIDTFNLKSKNIIEAEKELDELLEAQRKLHIDNDPNTNR